MRMPRSSARIGAGSSVVPSRNRSIAAAAERPSAIAQTMSDSAPGVARDEDARLARRVGAVAGDRARLGDRQRELVEIARLRPSEAHRDEHEVGGDLALRADLGRRRPSTYSVSATRSALTSPAPLSRN